MTDRPEPHGAEQGGAAPDGAVAAALRDRPRPRLARPLVLVGPMGAGKSTVGRVLAERLEAAFVDADELFTQVWGPIPEFFAAHGEPAFRRREARAVAAVLDAGVPAVLACGGGAVLTESTRRRLGGPGCDVVWLQVAESEALRRVGDGTGRPVLAGDPAGTWRRVLAERAPLYRSVADVTVDGTGLSPSDVASRIVESIVTEPVSERQE